MTPSYFAAILQGCPKESSSGGAEASTSFPTQLQLSHHKQCCTLGLGWTRNPLHVDITMNADAQDNPAPAAAISHFKSTTWASKFLDSSSYRLVPTSSRYLKSTGEDAFFARTINTPTTIPYCLSLCRQDLMLPEGGSSFNRTASPSTKSSPPLAPSVFDCVWLLHLAEPGINGHPSTAHGGVLACILDELTGVCAILHQADRSIPMYTASLETKFKAPVTVPTDVICTAWVTRKEGRKYWLRAQILDERGTVMTEGEALFIESKTKQKL